VVLLMVLLLHLHPLGVLLLEVLLLLGMASMLVVAAPLPQFF